MQVVYPFVERGFVSVRKKPWRLYLFEMSVHASPFKADRGSETLARVHPEMALFVHDSADTPQEAGPQFLNWTLTRACFVLMDGH